MSKTRIIFLALCLTICCSSCNFFSPENESQKEASLKKVVNVFSGISSIGVDQVHFSSDSLIINVKDSFPIFDPHFCEEISWWLAYGILNEFEFVKTVSYNWEFDSNDQERKAEIFVNRSIGLDELRSRYANQNYYRLLEKYNQDINFRNEIFALYDLYGAVLANDTTKEVVNIYFENIFILFATYSSTCLLADNSGKAKADLKMVENLSIKIGGKSSPLTKIIRAVLNTCPLETVEYQTQKSQIHFILQE